MFGVVLLCIGICLALYAYSTSTFNYWKHRGVIYARPIPFFGNIKPVITFQRTSGQCLQSIYNQFPDEPFVGMWMIRKPTMLVRSPEMIRDVLVKHFQDFMDRGHPFDESREPITAHLVNLTGDRWRHLRQKLSPAFTTGKLRLMTDLLVKCGETLSDYVSHLLETEQGSRLEIRELTAKYSTDVIGSVAFGLEFESFAAEDAPFRAMGRKVFSPSMKYAVSMVVRQFFPDVYNYLDLRSFPKNVNNFFEDLTKDTMEMRKNNNIQRNDFMHLLLKLKEEEERIQTENKSSTAFEFSMKTVAAQAFVFFAAGFETTSTTLSFCLYELALNPEIQIKAVQEVRNVKEKYGMLSYESTQEMTYVEHIIEETLRKHPPVMNLSRICTRTTTIPGTKIEIEEGTNVMIPVYAIHHDPQYYPNPEVFDPERFTPENSRKRPNFTFLPFGDGPRICIGMRFAYMEMKLCLAQFLEKFHVSPCIKTTIPLRYSKSFLLRPEGGLWLGVSSRIKTEEYSI
nr:PREDICTED: cytochrome P450 6k1-like isoform X1 [Bemisia tabaci]